MGMRVYIVWLGEYAGEIWGCGDGWMGEGVWGLGRFVERGGREGRDGGLDGGC